MNFFPINFVIFGTKLVEFFLFISERRSVGKTFLKLEQTGPAFLYVPVCFYVCVCVCV